MWLTSARGGLTGLKIGLMTVKVAALAAGIGLTGVSALAALAADAGTDGDVVVVSPCTSREMFWGRFAVAGGTPSLQGEEEVVELAKLGGKAALAGSAVFTGPGLAMARETLLAAGIAPERLLAGPECPRIGTLCRLGAALPVVDAHVLLPNYLVLTTAERNLGKRV